MATLVYGGTEYTFEDRLLSHLKIVVGMKLSRGESFYLNWDRPSGTPEAISVWVSPATPLQFRFPAAKPPELNQKWLRAMSDNSYGPRGLFLPDEPEEEPAPLSRKPSPQTR